MRFRKLFALHIFIYRYFLQFCCPCNHSIYCKTSLKVTFWRMSGFEIKWQWANGVLATMIANHPIYELVIQWLGHWAGCRAAKIVNCLRGETLCTSFMIGLILKINFVGCGLDLNSYKRFLSEETMLLLFRFFLNI